MKKKNALGRRSFLVGAGGATLALPFLPSLLPRASAAPDAPLRFIGVTSPNGQFPENWIPDMTSARIVAEDVKVLPFSEIDGNISPVIGDAFESVRDKLTLFLGLDGVGGGGHNYCFPLTAGGHVDNDKRAAPLFPYSMDAVMERSSSFYSELPALGALRLAPLQWSRSPKPKSHAWWTEGGVPTNLPAQWNASAVFDSLFGFSETPTGGIDPRERRRLAIDRVKEDYDRVQRSSRLSSADRHRLSNYADHMRDLQTRLARSQTLSCDGPPIDEDPADNRVLYENHSDLMVAAMACGITRIGTMHIAQATDEGGHGTRYHGVSHKRDAESAAISLGYNDWVGRRVAELMTKLDSLEESDGSTLLDNSVVLWCNEISGGGTHDAFNHPVLIGGGAGGRLRTGEIIDYRQDDDVRWARGKVLGRPYNQLLTTIMSTMGLGQEEWELGEGPGFGSYWRIGHDFARGAWDHFVGTERELLPHYVMG